MRTISFILALAFLTILGCSSGNDDSLAKKTGEKLGKNVTDLASGIGKGIDKSMSVEVVLSPEFAKRGLSKTTAKSSGMSTEKKGISVYLISEKKQSVPIIAKALNSEGLEIGRSKVTVDFEKDDAKYVEFLFHGEMDTALVKKYELSISQ